MYAGRISLVATEEGVGVNLGNLISNVGDIVLTADGKIQLASVQSAQNIDIHSNQEVELSKQQVVENQLTINANNLRLNQTDITAGDSITLNVNKNLTAQHSQLLSGVKANGQTNANVQLNVEAQQVSLVDSGIVSQGNVFGNISTLGLDPTSFVMASNIILTEVNAIESNCELNAKSQLKIEGEQLTLSGAGTMTANTVRVDASAIELDTNITANILSATTQSTLMVSKNANLQSITKTTLNAQSLTQQGQVSSNGNVTLNANTLSHEGTTSANNIELNTEFFTQRGQLIAEKNILVSATEAGLAGSTQAKQSINIAANNINVTGALESTALELVGSLGVNIDSSAQLSAINLLSIDANKLVNKGHVHSGDTLSIDADSLEHQGTLTSIGELQLNTSTVDIQSDIETQGNLNISASSITNNAEVIAGQDLSLFAESLSNSGTLTASGDTTVSLTNNFTHNSSGTISGQNVRLSAKQFENLGTLQALDNLGLSVNSMVNKGGLIALGDLTTMVVSGINNQGLIYAGNNANLYSNTLHNTSDIVVGHDLLIAKNLAKQKNNSVTNSSGTVESLGGDIDIYTHTLTNKRTTLEVESTTTEDKRAQYTGVYNTKGTEHEPKVYRSETCRDSGNDASSGKHCTTHYNIEPSYRNFTVIALKEGSQLKSASFTGRIAANNDLIIGANTVLNDASQMAGNKVTITANTLTNKGYQLDEYTTYFDYTLNSSWDPDYLPYTRTASRRVKTGVSGQVNSSITASHKLTLNVANTVNNSTLKANATAVLPTTSAAQVQVTSLASVTNPTITFANSNDIAFPEFTFPIVSNGLFVFSPDPKGKYLIETNPLLINMGQFLGSDYFMSRVGFNPEVDVKFLGDMFYDSRVISQAIFEQTGRQYLNNSVGSQLEQMQQLMDAAALQKDALNLSSGIALSSDQVANLTQDILWYEYIEVNGQTVLAPKLYLAQATIDNLSSGAQIAGIDVDINAGDIINSGHLSSDDNLNLTSKKSITNVGGSIAVDGGVSLTAGQDIINLSGDIQGGNVSIFAANGNIVNETRVITSQAKRGNSSGTFTDIGPKATIAASGNLVMEAGNNIENHAAIISAGGNVDLVADKDIVITAKENTQAYDVSHRRERIGESSTTQLGSSITSGKRLNVESANNIDIMASELSSKEMLSLKAGNDVTVQTAKNTQSEHLNTGKRASINRSIQHQGSSLTGADVSIQSGNSLTLSGSTIVAEGAVALKAKGDVSVLAVNDSVYHYDKTTNSKSFGRSKTTINESYKETVNGSSIQAGSDINITAKKHDTITLSGGESDIALIGSSLDAGGNVVLEADGDITLAAQRYKEFERHETLKKWVAGLSGNNKGCVDEAELLNSSYLINSGDTNLISGNHIGVIASEIVSNGNVNLDALDEVLIAAGDVLKQTQDWDEKIKFLSGGNLFELEKKRQGEQTVTAQSSVVQSGGNLIVNSGSIKMVGSELKADSNIEFIADTGSVEILAAKETTKAFESEETLSISMGDGWSRQLNHHGYRKLPRHHRPKSRHRAY
ncbi:hemagglutinin repeat-containing protein [Aliivibrio fischeri]|uniref:Uncharacterized protein n=1 Tax=Aliivibrio fischeri TaxID=668 RepID=A0A510UNG3_ALIFS|nr:hypothetical protein AFI02nite_40420 [Aliivibrio fischeri]